MGGRGGVVGGAGGRGRGEVFVGRGGGRLGRGRQAGQLGRVDGAQWGPFASVVLQQT